MFVNHKWKCRVCFRQLNGDFPMKNIASVEELRDTFHQFTGIELKISKLYSDRICPMCDHEVKRCNRFRNLVIERQTMLYQISLDGDVEMVNNEVTVKEEEQDDVTVIQKPMCDVKPKPKVIVVRKKPLWKVSNPTTVTKRKEVTTRPVKIVVVEEEDPEQVYRPQTEMVVVQEDPKHIYRPPIAPTEIKKEVISMHEPPKFHNLHATTSSSNPKSFKRRVKKRAISPEAELLIIDSDDGESVDYVTQVDTEFFDMKSIGGHQSRNNESQNCMTMQSVFIKSEDNEIELKTEDIEESEDVATTSTQSSAIQSKEITVSKRTLMKMIEHKKQKELEALTKKKKKEAAAEQKKVNYPYTKVKIAITCTHLNA